MSVEFTPSAWRRAGEAYESAGADLVDSVVRHLSVLDVSQIGCDRGAHLVDQALALVVPAVKDAFDAACRDLADSMATVGLAMVETGEAYAQVEQAGVDLAASIVEGS